MYYIQHRFLKSNLTHLKIHLLRKFKISGIKSISVLLLLSTRIVLKFQFNKVKYISLIIRIQFILNTLLKGDWLDFRLTTRAKSGENLNEVVHLLFYYAKVGNSFKLQYLRVLC